MFSDLLKIGIGAAAVFAALKAIEQPVEFSPTTGLMVCAAGLGAVILAVVLFQNSAE